LTARVGLKDPTANGKKRRPGWKSVWPHITGPRPKGTQYWIQGCKGGGADSKREEIGQRLVPSHFAKLCRVITEAPHREQQRTKEKMGKREGGKSQKKDAETGNWSSWGDKVDETGRPCTGRRMPQFRSLHVTVTLFREGRFWSKRPGVGRAEETRTAGRTSTVNLLLKG